MSRPVDLKRAAFWEHLICLDCGWDAAADDMDDPLFCEECGENFMVPAKKLFHFIEEVMDE